MHAVIKYFLKALSEDPRAHIVRCFSLAALILLMAGCSAVKRDHYDVPEVPLPKQFKNVPAVDSPAADSDSSKPSDSKKSPAKSEIDLDPVLVEWWHAFANPELDSLINRGLANNPDVRIATYKLAQAKARSSQADAGKGPTITAPLQINGSAPYYGPAGPVTPQGGNVDGPNGKRFKQLFEPSIRGDWRVDLWGELSSLAESANLQVWRASFERDNFEGNVAANIASTYVEYLSLNDRIHVAHETETVLTGMLDSVKGRMESGDATAIDLEQQRSAVYSVRATIPALEQQREDALGTLAFLVGTVPESIKLSDNGLDSLYLPSVTPGVPSSLLLRRPDVRMVEARLLAADADIDVARARVLPPLDLNAQVGYGSYYLADLFKPQALFWNAIASMSVTIFDGGKLSKEKDYAKAVHEEMVETYVRTIYQAVREVDVALNAIRQTGAQLDAQKESADAAQRAWNYSTEVYAAGAIDYPTLLTTERSYHQTLDDFHRIRMDRYRALVSLFHALGGGVPQGDVLPGKGVRPVSPQAGQHGLIATSPNKNGLAAESADWVENPIYEKEDTWLVELPGVYPRKTIDAAWLDLRTRFPALMEKRSLRHYQQGSKKDNSNKRFSWYQLYIAKFPTAAAAEEVCSTMRLSHQRCSVVFSKMGNIDELATTSGMFDVLGFSSKEKQSKPVLMDGQVGQPGKAEVSQSQTLSLPKRKSDTNASGNVVMAEKPVRTAPLPPVAQSLLSHRSTVNSGSEGAENVSPGYELPSWFDSGIPSWHELAMPDLPELSLPDFSDWSLPEFSLPELDFSLPEFELPSFDFSSKTQDPKGLAEVTG
jgi:NodT family efflux transporter outer membrane factor (OMF) lipoprotein